MKILLSLLALAAGAVAFQDEPEPSPLARAGSLLARPLYRTEAPPPMRAARHIVILHAGVSRKVMKHDDQRTPEEALAVARELVARLRDGADFMEIAREHSGAPNLHRGALLGSFPEGMLMAQLDRFLWTSETGDVSDPIDTPFGFQILERIDSRAGVKQILLQGEGAERKARELRARLAQGEDFGELAREHSMDEASAERGGEYAIYVRGSKDNLLKALAFELELGEISEPYQSPLGWHILQRVDPDSVDPALDEKLFVRARAIVVSWKGAVAAPPGLERTKGEAFEVADQIHKRVTAGESMTEYASSEYNDDPGGREREGDLGWLYRRNPDAPNFLSELFVVQPGTLLSIKETTAGYVVLRRTE